MYPHPTSSAQNSTSPLRTNSNSTTTPHQHKSNSKAKHSREEPSPSHNGNPKLSCAECRRRKLRCDRRVPCSACVRRGCKDLCPDRVMGQKYTEEDLEKLPSYIAMKDRILSLEAALRRNYLPETARASPDSVLLARAGGNGEREEADREEDWVPSFGTLVIGTGGRARYVGATAASEWLNETMGSGPGSETPPIKRPGPSTSTTQIRSISTSFSSTPQGFLFPYGGTGDEEPSFEWLRSQLPSYDEACALAGYYFRHYAWNYNIIPRAEFDQLLSSFYPNKPIPTESDTRSDENHPHKLGLLFMVLAMGSLFNLEMEPEMESGKRFYVCCAQCLAVGDLMRQNTMASLQTLHIMINYVLYVDRIKGGDTAWVLWGVAWRLIIAMGMHRDGEQWKLSSNILDERRRTFWEIFAEETFQANCFGRPGGLYAGHHNVQYPLELEPRGVGEDGELGYSSIKFRLAKIANRVLHQAMCVDPPSYTSVLQSYHKLADFEKSIPYFLRCQPALLALLSVYPDQKEALAASPPVDSSELRLTFQQHGLAMNVSETVLFLLRPFFARALHDNPIDPSLGKYGEAFLAVVERCKIIIAIFASIHTVFPKLAYRHWFFEYHASSAAVCMASLVIAAPQSPLALLGWTNLSKVCELFTSIAPNSKPTSNSLALLNRLRRAAHLKLQGRWQFNAGNELNGHPQLVPVGVELESESDPPDTQAEEQSSILIGLHSRLVDRMNEDMAVSHIIRVPVRVSRERSTVLSPGGSSSHKIVTPHWTLPAPETPAWGVPYQYEPTPSRDELFGLNANVPIGFDMPMDIDPLSTGSVNVLGQLWPRTDVDPLYQWSVDNYGMDWSLIEGMGGFGQGSESGPGQGPEPGQGRGHGRG